jgi:hypothetical protein
MQNDSGTRGEPAGSPIQLNQVAVALSPEEEEEKRIDEMWIAKYGRGAAQEFRRCRDAEKQLRAAQERLLKAQEKLCKARERRRESEELPTPEEQLRLVVTRRWKKGVSDTEIAEDFGWTLEYLQLHYPDKP